MYYIERDYGDETYLLRLIAKYDGFTCTKEQVIDLIAQGETVIGCTKDKFRIFKSERDSLKYEITKDKLTGGRKYGMFVFTDEGDDDCNYDVICGVIDEKATGKIVIPNFVQVLEDTAFCACKTITEVMIPDSVSHIGVECFESCTNLKKVIIQGDSITLDAHCFSFCTSLETVTLPKRVESFGDYCFAECHSLRKINKPEQIGYVGFGCFLDCDELKRPIV